MGTVCSTGRRYLAGTDPRDPSSCLRIESIAVGLPVSLSFHAVSNKTYSVEFTDDLQSGTWSKLADVLARPATRRETVVDPDFRPNRLYRLVTPRQP